MPSTASSTSVLMSAATQEQVTTIKSILGRATEVTGRLLAAATISPALNINSQQNLSASSSVSLVSSLSQSMAAITMSTTTEAAAAATTTTAPSLHGLEVVVSPMTPASLYSFEELGEWSSSSHYTALIHALIASFSVILVSELGDKTFIITAIMAMKNSRSLVFISSAFALLLMTVLSVGMGVAVTVIPELYTHYASILLFLCFGLKMLKESYDMSTVDNPGAESEFDEVKRSLETDAYDADQGDQQVDCDKIQKDANDIVPLNKSSCNQADYNQGEANDDTDGKSPISSTSNWWTRLVQTLYVAPIVIKVFTMVFVAEWGDRSQISTVILAAREDVIGVFIGSLSGHVLCTGLAVIGGRFVADMISVRTMTFLGGIIFLFFAFFAIFSGPQQQI